jgi:hypothetical protein
MKTPVSMRGAVGGRFSGGFTQVRYVDVLIATATQ